MSVGVYSAAAGAQKMRYRIIMLVFAALSATKANGCDGPDPGPLRDRYRNAEAVAVIRVESLRVSENGYEVEGSGVVQELLKGAPATTVPIRGYTPLVDCWASIDVGGEYVAFVPKAWPGRGRVSFGMFGTSVLLR